MNKWYRDEIGWYAWSMTLAASVAAVALMAVIFGLSWVIASHGCDVYSQQAGYETRFAFFECYVDTPHGTFTTDQLIGNQGN